MPTQYGKELERKADIVQAAAEIQRLLLLMLGDPNMIVVSSFEKGMAVEVERDHADTHYFDIALTFAGWPAKECQDNRPISDPSIPPEEER